MHWTRWIILALVLLNAGWMVFDGSRAMIIGDYVTPKSGRHAGQLGPWSKVVETIGIPPRSTAMKSAFVIYGLLFIAMTVAFVLGAPWARTGLIVVAALGLWHLPFGTLINLIVLGLVLVGGVRR